MRAVAIMVRIATFATEIKKSIAMKRIILAIACVASVLSLRAQESTFNEGNLVFNAGLGLGTTLYSGRHYSSFLPPISVSGEYGLIEDFIAEDITLGVGGYIGLAGAEYRFPASNWGWRYNYTVIGVRGALHYPLVDKLDTYGGIMLGYNAVSVRDVGDVPSGFSSASGGLSLAIYLGGRYYFSERFGLMGEVGYGVSYLNIGVALKL